MRIALMADTHNSLGRLSSAAARLRAEGMTTLLHAGDVTGASALPFLAEFEVWIASGNMDELDLAEAVQAQCGPGRYAEFHALRLGGVSIALLHGHDSARLQQAIRSGVYRYVIHGHTHRRRNEHIGTTHVINPGSLARPVDGNAPAIAILELETGEVEFIKI